MKSQAQSATDNHFQSLYPSTAKHVFPFPDESGTAPAPESIVSNPGSTFDLTDQAAGCLYGWIQASGGCVTTPIRQVKPSSADDMPRMGTLWICKCINMETQTHVCTHTLVPQWPTWRG